MNKAEFLNGLLAGIKAVRQLKEEATTRNDVKAYEQALKAEAALISSYKQAAA